MIIHTEGAVRTSVEDLFLKEMVAEDMQFLVLGECDDVALDIMSDEESSSGGLFDDDISDDQDIEDILDSDDDNFLYND